MEEVQLNQTFMRGHCPKERMPERYNLRMLLPRSMFLCTKSGVENSQTARADLGEKQVFEDVKTRRQDSTIENVMRMDELTRFSDAMSKFRMKTFCFLFASFLPADHRKGQRNESEMKKNAEHHNLGRSTLPARNPEVGKCTNIKVEVTKPDSGQQEAMPSTLGHMEATVGSPHMADNSQSSWDAIGSGSQDQRMWDSTNPLTTSKVVVSQAMLFLLICPKLVFLMSSMQKSFSVGCLEEAIPLAILVQIWLADLRMKTGTVLDAIFGGAQPRTNDLKLREIMTSVSSLFQSEQQMKADLCDTSSINAALTTVILSVWWRERGMDTWRTGHSLQLDNCNMPEVAKEVRELDS